MATLISLEMKKADHLVKAALTSVLLMYFISPSSDYKPLYQNISASEDVEGVKYAVSSLIILL